jgi:hypothetical protein
MPEHHTPFQQKKSRLDSLFKQQTKWHPAWKDLQEYINQTRGQFGDGEPQREKMINHKVILDGHATRAVKYMASGLKSGMVSPSKPWFRLEVKDENLNKLPHVRAWLDESRDQMLGVVNESNMYDVFQSVFEELGQFGTGCCAVLEDPDSVIRGRAFTCGEYVLIIDDSGRVIGFGRKFWMTIENAVRAFGLENCSTTVQASYRNKDYHEMVRVCNLVEKNDKRDPNFADRLNMAYSSCYWEDTNNEEKFLQVGGFEDFPIMGPRWETATTNQVYGHGPGWYALGDIKQLQKTSLDKLLAQEKLHNPPMQADASLGDNATNLLPGGLTRTSNTTPNGGIRPAYEVRVDINSFREMIMHLHDNIDKDFFVNIFLMLVNIDKTNMTATEVAERQQEKLNMLGPILERIEEQLLDPFLERLFNIMSRGALLPPAPPEIEGIGIKRVYTSVLAQAQRAVGIVSIERVIGFVGQVVEMYPEARHVLNIEESIREIHDMAGAPGSILNSVETIEKIKKAEEQAAQQAQMAEMANNGADTAAKLAKVNMDENNAAANIARSVSEQ